MAIFSNQKHQISNAAPILIVESNPDEWLLIRASLAKCFPEVAPLWMSTPAQAVTYLESISEEKTKLPALIVVDHLPHQQEIWFLLKSLKDNLFYRHIPVIFLSHSTEPSHINQAYNLGAASCIVKPTTYHFWVKCFVGFRSYWWKLARLPVKSRL